MDGTEQQRHGSRIYLDDVEYGYASANNKKSAKSDAALIAFVAFVKDVYTNSGKLHISEKQLWWVLHEPHHEKICFCHM